MKVYCHKEICPYSGCINSNQVMGAEIYWRNSSVWQLPQRNRWTRSATVTRLIQSHCTHRGRTIHHTRPALRGLITRHWIYDSHPHVAQTRSSDWTLADSGAGRQINILRGGQCPGPAPCIMAHNVTMEGLSYLSRKKSSHDWPLTPGDSSAHTWLMFQLRGRALRKETLIMDYNLGVVCSNNQHI